MHARTGFVLVTSIAVAASAFPGRLDAQTTAFTYQGALQRSGGAVSEVCDLDFTLHDSAEGGSVLADRLVDDVPIAGGLFTVQLDFGGTVFDGADRWLGIAVRCPAGSGAFAALLPRQLLTPAPYALHARSAAAVPWAGIGGLPAGFADGTDDDTAYFAGAGMTLLGNTFEVNTDVIQQRVAVDCAAGSSIREIGNNGSVVCEPDDGQTYAAGEGLLLTDATFNVDTDRIQRRVDTLCPLGQSIRVIAANGAVTCEADDDSGGDITTVTAGTGLVGGGSTGAVALSVVFAGSGGSASAARSDHDHFGDAWTGSASAGLTVQNGGTVAVLGQGGLPAAAGGIAGIPPGSISIGVWGESPSVEGIGVLGTAKALSSLTVGVQGTSDSSSGIGVRGEATRGSGLTYGVHGQSASTRGVGVYGESTAAIGDPGGIPTGILGTSVAGIGIVGSSSAPSGVGIAGSGTIGITGQSSASSGKGVSGIATAASGLAIGTYGESASTGGRGAVGKSTAASGFAYGVVGESASPDGKGMLGAATANSGVAVGVQGESRSASGYGGYFVNLNAGGGVGLYARGGTGSATDLILGGTTGGGTADDGVISSDPLFVSSDLFLLTNDGVVIDLDEDGSAEDADFEIVDRNDVRIFDVDDSGDVFAKTFNPGGADFAEMLPAEEGLEPGEVLVIGPEGTLRRSTAPYQPNVAGVYSTTPGVIGGRGMDEDVVGKVPLAIVGVVPVRASAENGAIRPGDLLTTAATPGHAMRCEDRGACAGAIVGKALGPLFDGSGTIRALIVLQ